MKGEYRMKSGQLTLNSSEVGGRTENWGKGQRPVQRR